MRWYEFWQKIANLDAPILDTEEKQRQRSARVLEAEAALQRAIAEEAHSRGRLDSARERRRLAASLEEEAALLRLTDEYDVISGGTPPRVEDDSR